MAPAYEFAIPARARKPFPGCRGRGSVYARVSGESDPKTISLETQAQGQIDALIAAGFWLEPEDVLFDRFSGVDSLAFRDQLMDLRDLAEDGYYQAIAFHDPDRLVRGIEVVNVVQEIEAVGCEVWFDGRRSEPSDERDLLLAVGGYASKKEAKQILERTMRARRRIREDGEWYGAGPPCYGLRFDKRTRRRVLDGIYDLVVTRIFRLADDGLTPRAICRVLNEDRILPPSASLGTERSLERAKTALWSEATVRQILKDESYIGKAYINQVTYRRDDRGRIMRRGRRKLKCRVPRDQWIEVPGRTDPIVPEDLFRRVGARMRARDSNADRGVDRQEGRSFLLRGLLFCGTCRRKMYPKAAVSGEPRKRFCTYVCQCNQNRRGVKEGGCPGPSVSITRVDPHARAILDALIAHPEVIAGSVDAALSAGDADEARLRREAERVAASVATLGRQLAAYAGDLNDPDLGDRSRKAIRGEMALVERQLAERERTRDEVESQLAAYADRGQLREEYVRRCERALSLMRDRDDRLGDDDYRLFMEGMGLRFYFHRGVDGPRSIRLEPECQPGPWFKAGAVDLAAAGMDLADDGASGSGYTAYHQIDLPRLTIQISSSLATGV